jgi:hypothetical protein
MERLFFVRWRSLWKINWLLRPWRRHALKPHEENFLQNIRDVLRNYRKLTPKQQDWLNLLYDRERSRQKR